MEALKNLPQNISKSLKAFKAKVHIIWRGLCFGGTIAVEIGQQLKKQNESVEKLIIFDAQYVDDEELQKAIIED